ncbi:MAG: metallopeptidase family protein [Candidatus Kerfeldbacteria bacterium]|nr:metallopeptidase family protein [Candidatus Kerfeldbacteria bacterium]
MEIREFEQIVSHALANTQPKFLRQLNNVAVVIADEPTPAQRQELKLRKGETLYGVYEGVPQTRRGTGYSGVLPDKITIFRRPIESQARSVAEIEELVRQTVWHELAHHFGLDEARVRRSEIRRRRVRTN